MKKYIYYLLSIYIYLHLIVPVGSVVSYHCINGLTRKPFTAEQNEVEITLLNELCEVKVYYNGMTATKLFASATDETWKVFKFSYMPYVS